MVLVEEKKMSVNAGSPLAREWAREEIEKFNRLDLAEMDSDANSRYRIVVMKGDYTLALKIVSEGALLSYLARNTTAIGKIIFVEEVERG